MTLRPLVALAAVVALAACASGGPQTPTVVTAAQTGGAVTLAEGDTLLVTLGAQPSTGYRWRTQGLTGATLVPVGSADYLPAQVAAGTVGAPGDAVFRFAAQDLGKVGLDLVYTRPFEPGVAPVRSVHYDVTVVARPSAWMAAWTGKP